MLFLFEFKEDFLKMQRDFKGIWIPKEIWLNENLGWSEKLLLVEIGSLANNGECFASNEYFAKFFGVSKDRISKMITKLKRLNLIEVGLIYKAGTKEIDKRVLTTTPIGENAYTPTTKTPIPIGENAYTPIGENAYYNNTLINNTTINTTNKRYKTNELENEFETLWKLYPRKIGKAKAQASYLKARKTHKEEYETIKEGLNNYIKYVESRQIEEQYIMHGSTWFAQSKWLDEYTSTLPQKRITSYLDLYENDFGAKGENAFEFRGDREIINDYSNLLPYPPQKF